MFPVVLLPSKNCWWQTYNDRSKTHGLFRLPGRQPGRTDFYQVKWPGRPWCSAATGRRHRQWY